MAECYRDHVQAVLDAVRPILGSADSETVVHEVYLRLISSASLRASFTGGSVVAWLRTLARRAAIDFTRRYQRELPTDFNPDGDALTTESFVNASEARVLIDRFRRDALPRQWRDVFEARFVLRLDQREAARRLGLKRTTLAYQEQRIARSLRKFVLYPRGATSPDTTRGRDTKTMKNIVLLGCLLIPTGALAQAQVYVPHTFTPGTTAHAQEVNDNFSTLQNFVNELSELLSSNLAQSDVVTDEQELLDALAAGKPRIVVAGTIPLTATVTISNSVTIEGRSDVVSFEGSSPFAPGVPLFEITSGNVELRNLNISTDNADVAFACDSGTLHLERTAVTIFGATRGTSTGMVADAGASCSFSAWRSTLSTNGYQNSMVVRMNGSWYNTLTDTVVEAANGDSSAVAVRLNGGALTIEGGSLRAYGGAGGFALETAQSPEVRLRRAQAAYGQVKLSDTPSVTIAYSEINNGFSITGTPTLYCLGNYDSYLQPVACP